jgi:hypothetical protein
LDVGSYVELSDALRGLSAALEADGYVLDARWADDRRVEIKIHATPDACVDCLVPWNVMRGIAVSMLGDAGMPVADDDVLLTYPDGSAAR